jgi:hypothetical protein
VRVVRRASRLLGFHQGEDSRIKRYRQRLTSPVWRAKLCGNGTIRADGGASLGFQGTWTSSDAVPTSFTLNGTACATGQDAT